MSAGDSGVDSEWRPGSFEELTGAFVRVRRANPVPVGEAFRAYSWFETVGGALFVASGVITFPALAIVFHNQGAPAITSIGLILFWIVYCLFMPAFFFAAKFGGLYASRTGVEVRGMTQWGGLRYGRASASWSDVAPFEVSSRSRPGNVQAIVVELRGRKSMNLTARLFAAALADHGWDYGGAQRVDDVKRLVDHLNAIRASALS